MSTADPSNDDKMSAEVDFSSGARGKFYRPGATLALPVYLETEVQARLALLDWLLHHAHIVQISCESYRLKDRKKARNLKVSNRE